MKNKKTKTIVLPGRHISTRLGNPADRILFYKLCALKETNMSEALNNFVIAYIAKHRNLLKNNGVDQEDTEITDTEI